MRGFVCFLVLVMWSGGELSAGGRGSLAKSWQKFVAGTGMLTILCTGCASKMVLDKKYKDAVAITAMTGFAAQVSLGILAAEEKVHPAFAWTASGIYTAIVIFGISTEFDYGPYGHHVKSGGVDWYGLKSDLYYLHPNERIYGVRMDGQQQFETRRQDLIPWNYNGVMVHFRRDGQDYAAKLWEPKRSRFRYRYHPGGIYIRIRTPIPTLPKPRMRFHSLRPYDGYGIGLDEILGVYITDHPEYDNEGWVIIEDGERLLYGRITHVFTSDHAQVKITAIQEGDNLIELAEDEAFYRMFPMERLQRE